MKMTLTTPFGCKNFAMFVRESQFLTGGMIARVYDRQSGLGKEFTISQTTLEAAQAANPDFDVHPMDVFYAWQKKQH